MLNPQIAYRLDARILLTHLHRVSQTDLRDLQGDFARYLTTREAAHHTTWQDAWNAFTGAQPNRTVQIRFTPSRCTTCSGRGFSTRHIARSIARTGSPYICPDCRGSRRGQPTTVTAMYITPPATSQPTDPASTDLDGGLA